MTLRHIKCARVAAHAEDFCVRRHRRRDCCIAAVLLQSMNGGNSGLTHLISCGLLPSSLGTLACSGTTIQKNDEVNFLTKGPLPFSTLWFPTIPEEDHDALPPAYVVPLQHCKLLLPSAAAAWLFSASFHGGKIYRPRYHTHNSSR